MHTAAAGTLALAARMADLPRSGIREIVDLAAGIPGVVHLEVGEPDFPTPPHIVAAAAEAAAAGFTRYTSSRGLPSLRAALVDKLARRNGIDAADDDVIVTCGGVNAVFSAICVLAGPGDAVLVPDPGWPNTEAMVRILGATPVRYPLRDDAGFEPDPDEIRGLMAASGSRVIYLNSPSNPTGAVFRAETIERLAAVARERDAWIVSDECYEDITFGAEHVGAARFAPERTFSVFSFSKSYAMTGWRVGYVATPPGIGDHIAKIQEPVISCPAGPCQKAAEAALAGPQDVVAAMAREYRSRRDQVVRDLDGTGLLLTVPEGAFYALVDIRSSGRSSRAFAIDLVRDHGVAVAPGATFGPSTDHAIRVSLASSPAALSDGIARIRAALGM